MARLTFIILVVVLVVLYVSRRSPRTFEPDVTFDRDLIHRLEQLDARASDRSWVRVPEPTESRVAELTADFDTGETTPPDAARSDEVLRVIGCTASWYGEALRGNPTASGELYDPDGLTAASRELRLGTILEVQHADHPERVVRVVVNDRGPWVHTDVRCLDLSRAAFEVLAPLEAGLIPVVAYVVGEEYGRATADADATAP